MTISLSAIIIAKDEEEDLPSCLLSLAGLADEIVIIVDSKSSDKTESIAQEYGCKTARRIFDSYAAQKQAALDLAQGQWVLSIDADERVSPTLKEEIARFIAQPQSIDGAILRFRIEFMGKILRFGGVGHEKHLRLFRREKGRFAGGVLHEGLEILGPISSPFRGSIEHKPYEDLSDYLQKMDRYLTLSSIKGRAAGKRLHWWHHLIIPWENFSRLILKLGVLDGKPGMVWAGLSAFHHWLKYVKLDDISTTERRAKENLQ